MIIYDPIIGPRFDPKTFVPLADVASEKQFGCKLIRCLWDYD